ncbi:MAG: isoprenoid biosynthesis glyoxalase ElbB [Bacteroidales bacterium]|nr:isoprenoid biosynthesis glyoxalase ElbB [Bacteroidales bacterium]
MKTIAVILSGCGNRDGSELQETLGLLLAIDRHGFKYQCFAPQGSFKVVSYLDNDGETGEVRDLFAEAARIARGDIRPLDEYLANDYAALALPGGMGAARNLSTYAFDGTNMNVLPEVEKAILDTHAAGKPVVAMCIAPIVLSKVMGHLGVKLTLGDICAASRAAVAMGANHEVCGPTDICVDNANKVITTPAYMVATHISQIFDGAENMIAKLSEWI